MVTQHGDEHDIPDEHKVHRAGAWLPADSRTHREWLGEQIDHVEKHPQNLAPEIQEFKELIEGNTRIYMLASSMFEELPVKKPYNKDPTGHKQFRDYHQMLQVLNHILGTGPVWTDSAQHVGMVGVPMNAIFDWPMGTSSGHNFFLDPDVNKCLKKVLNAWGKFLLSPKSAEVLGNNKNGWFGPTAVKDIEAIANGPLGTSHKFQDCFKCDPSAKHYGYKSWDHFFTRELQDGYRPVASPDDNSIIANACESKTYHVSPNSSLRARFWIKGQPYSILDMLAHDELSHLFAGATVYQAFLSALSYHRWHSPVSGTIKKAYVVDGTYFSEPLFEGLGDHNTAEINMGGISTGQGYITSLAARAIIFIEADNPAIGLMAFIGVGMDEVSTCDITVKEGQHIKKGEQTGMFHFGGSSHCLLFRKGVKVEGFPEIGNSQNVPVRSQLAVVKS